MEKVCFEIKDVKMTYLDRDVLAIDRLAIHQFDRIGIVGQNGAGKSTVLKILSGAVQPTGGSVQCHTNFGYFEQAKAPEMFDVDYGVNGKWGVPDRLHGLSGGEQTRLKLAQLFARYNEALLIDEPTTHLDQDGISFLMNELNYYYGALVIVSHDRALLNALVTKIWEVADGKVNVYEGNYDDYTSQKRLEKEQLSETHEQYKKEKDRLEKAVEIKFKKAEKLAKSSQQFRKEGKDFHNRLTGTKSKGTSEKSIQRAAKAIEQRIGRLEEAEAPKQEARVKFRQSPALQLHNKFPIMADRLVLLADEHCLLEEASFQFPLGKTIAITGNNGSGKTTLLRHIQVKGEGLILSPKVKMGVYEQMAYQFSKSETVLEFIRKESDYHEGEIRSVLHQMGFHNNDLLKCVRSLSGGEAIRLTLCRLFLGRYNVLLLDEPTNFLDVACMEALEEFIRAYEGTVLLVSHDRTFIERVADEEYRISNRRICRMP